MNRRWFMLLLVAALLVGIVPSAALAHGGGNKPTPIYLSLGTSLAAGSQADDNGDTTLFSDQSYTDQLYKRLRWVYGYNLEHIKLGCAGETLESIDALNPACLANPAYDPSDHKSQLEMAEEVLDTERVALVTIDIGANDIFALQDACGNDPECILGSLPGLAVGAAQLIGALASEGVPVIAMNYYNPQAAGLALGEPAYQEVAFSTTVLHAFGVLLEQFVSPAGVSVVDVYSMFHAADVPLEVQAFYPFFGLPPELVPDIPPWKIDNFPRNGVPDALDHVCTLTFMCPSEPGVNPNIHPDEHGYRVIARGFFWEVLKTHRF